MVKLLKWEEDLLPLSLITPKEWAEQIRRRNVGLLDALERRDDDYTGLEGCPHCQEVGQRSAHHDSCCGCRWYAALDGCGSAVFDGLSIGDALGVEYSENCETLDPDIFPEFSHRFLKAHILWADRIIDGTYVEYAKHHGIETLVKDEDGIWRKA